MLLIEVSEKRSRIGNVQLQLSSQSLFMACLISLPTGAFNTRDVTVINAVGEPGRRQVASDLRAF